MRHRKAGRKFNRSHSHRAAMYRNLAVSIIIHELVQTTVAKGKEIRRFLEPLITRAAKDDLATRRYLFAKLRSEEAVAKLLNILGPRYAKRPGGYLRVLKSGPRPGDHAAMAYVLLVEAEPKVKEAPAQVEETSKEVAQD